MRETFIYYIKNNRLQIRKLLQVRIEFQMKNDGEGMYGKKEKTRIVCFWSRETFKSDLLNMNASKSKDSTSRCLKLYIAIC